MTKKQHFGQLITFLHEYHKLKSGIIASKSALIQTNRIADALQHACSETFCVSDVDATLYTPSQYFGGPTWADRYLLELKKKHQDDDKAFIELLALFDAVQAKTRVKPVENNTSSIMQHLAANSLGLMGLTARREALKATTIKQLDSIGIVPNQGVIFAAGRPKGPILAEHLLKLDVLPKRVLYIEDTLHEAESVKAAMENLGVETVCLHYTLAHEKTFCFKIAEKQRKIFEAHGVLIEDEYAETLIYHEQQRPSPAW